LSAKIDVLEDALTTNTKTTNQNQDLLVQQINALKAELDHIQKRTNPATPASGIIIPGNQQ